MAGIVEICNDVAAPGSIRKGDPPMRINSLSIQDFRGFRRFEMKDLGRINLIVGTNNSGKTTVLEAINVLMASGDGYPIWSILSRRGEDVWPERDGVTVYGSRQVDIRRLFHGHEIDVGASFEVSADTDFGLVSMAAKIKEYRPVQPQLFELEPLSVESSEAFLLPLSLSLYWSSGLSKGIEFAVTISQQGGISTESLRRSSRESPGKTFPLGFLTASSLTAEVAMSSFGEIVLTPEEEVVTDALRIIDPSIERLAPGGSVRVTSPGGRSPTHGGIFMRLKDVKDRVPIGSMGDGIWRMLGLALFVVRCRNGILLVDEIDTGLHYTVMEDMWKFLDSAAKTYNVQVFATTHSRDCYESLAAIAHGSVSDNSDVTIQRIERGRQEAVAYSEGHILAAAKHDIEVR